MFEKYLSLADIPSKSSCIIIRVNGHGGFRHRVMELGFVKGEKVSVIKNAPLMDPIEYEIMNTHVSLRRSEAEMIEVVLLQDYKSETAYFNGVLQESEAELKYREQPNVILVALVGNPNSGKTSFFNHATGLREKVGNYSGVTVDSKTGTFHWKGYKIRMTDLPGTYSTTEFSQEEVFVREYISNNRPDVILNIVNASNLERSMFLTTQLIDMNIRMVMSLNMYDELEKTGASINYKNLSKLLGFPIVPTISTKGTGIEGVLQAIVDVFEDKKDTTKHIHINYGIDIENSISIIKNKLEENKDEVNMFPSRFVSLKLLSDDSVTKKEITGFSNAEDIIKEASIQRSHLERQFKEDIDTIIADARYGFIRGALKDNVKNDDNAKNSLAYSLDAVLTNKWLGFPVLILFLWLMFQTTFSLGKYPQSWIESAVALFGNYCSNILPECVFSDLIVDGIIKGVGGVLVFLPNILILFWFISLLEDTGYMARAAFIMDKLMHRIGLHGKSFIPFLVGFGCSVPAIMATRMLENKKDRIITILAIPFMSCSARLPVYILFVSAFFAKQQGLIMLSLYFIGIFFGIITSLILKKTIFKSVSDDFVIELPPYRVPTARNTLMHMWNKSAQYIKKIGSVILIASVVIWFLEYFPRNSEKSLAIDSQIAILQSSANYNELTNTKEIHELEIDKLATQKENSYIGQLGKFVNPVFKPLGFDWKMVVSILSGLAAKEVIVSSMEILYKADNPESNNNLSFFIQNAKNSNGDKIFTPLIAYTFMMFVLLYFPCFATLTAISRETRLKWAIFSMCYTTCIAWIVSFGIYQIGTLIM